MKRNQRIIEISREIARKRVVSADGKTRISWQEYAAKHALEYKHSSRSRIRRRYVDDAATLGASQMFGAFYQEEFDLMLEASRNLESLLINKLSNSANWTGPHLFTPNQ